MVLNKKHIIFIIFSLFVLMFTCQISAQVRVEPARIIMHCGGGERETGVIKVINTGDEEAELKAFLYDWSLDEKDSLLTYEAGTLDITLDDLIKFNPRQFTIKPGESQQVRFTITAPNDFEKERRGIVFFEKDTGLIQAETGARIKTQIGSNIYFIPKDVYYNFKLNGFKIQDFEDDRTQINHLLIKNNGNAHFRFTINYKIIDDENVLIEEGEVQEKVLLPGFERILSYQFNNKLSHGSYKLLLTVNFKSTNRNAEYQVPFEIR